MSTNPWDYREADGDYSPRATVVQVEALGKGGVLSIILVGLAGVVLSAIALGLAGRAYDRATIAEREARIAQDKYTYAQIELAKKGIVISTSGH